MSRALVMSASGFPMTFNTPLRIASVFMAISILAACGKPQDRGVIEGASLPPTVVAEKLARQQASAPSNNLHHSSLVLKENAVSIFSVSADQVLLSYCDSGSTSSISKIRSNSR